jgi:hypothetical protein
VVAATFRMVTGVMMAGLNSIQIESGYKRTKAQELCATVGRVNAKRQALTEINRSALQTRPRLQGIYLMEGQKLDRWAAWATEEGETVAACWDADIEFSKQL